MMIRGIVNPRHEAVVPLQVRGPQGLLLGLEAVIDTGFHGTLTLSPGDVASLGLVRQSVGTVRLADGSRQAFDVFSAELNWYGAWRPILVSAIGNEALLGMQLLATHELRIVVIPGGMVEISPLP